jgi:hypothetical protein
MQIQWNKFLPDEIIDLFQQDGFIIFISGGKEHGKTNSAMLMAEICYYAKLRKHFATNIGVESYFIEKINNKPDLEVWLEQSKGKKLFIMDELGKIMRKMGFASKKNQALLDILQLIRHYDCGFIGIAPSPRFVDSNFLNSDLLDAHIRKISKTVAKINDHYHGYSYFINDLPKTSIIHNGKDIATFSMEKRKDIEGLPDCCKAAVYYAKTKNYANAGKFFNPPKEAMQIRRLILQHLEHTVT